MKLALRLRNAIAGAVLADIDNGALSSKLEIYAGTMPSAMGGAISSVKLAEVLLPAPFGVVANGVVTMAAVVDEPAALQTGLATWARILGRSGDEITYLTVSIAGGGGQVILNTVQIAQDGPVVVRSCLFVVGGG